MALSTYDELRDSIANWADRADLAQFIPDFVALCEARFNRELRLRSMEQKEYATLRAWIEPWTPLRVPLITNLRRDPYERAHVTSNTYYDWMIDRVFFLVPAQQYVADFLKTFREFPPRQKPASFSIDQVMEKLQTAGGSK